MVSSPRAKTPAATQNACTVRRLVEEVWGRGDLALLPSLMSDAYVGHLPIGDHYGPEGARIDIDAYRRALPDLTIALEELFAHGDRVVRRFTMRGTHRRPFLGMPASGQCVVLRGIAIDRLEDGLIVESWVQLDAMAGAGDIVH